MSKTLAPFDRYPVSLGTSIEQLASADNTANSSACSGVLGGFVLLGTWL